MKNIQMTSVITLVLFQFSCKNHKEETIIVKKGSIIRNDFSRKRA